MATSKPTPSRGPGFAFGVALGAFLGTGAMILLYDHPETHELKKSLRQKLKTHLKTLKDKYPEESEQFEHLMTSSLNELKRANLEIKATAAEVTQKAKQVADTYQEHSPEKRTFTRSGKKLNPDT